MKENNICVNGLTKDYGNNKGVFNVSFKVKSGEVFGFLGPNGAGKTTTIRHILGFLNADKGSCKIGNYECRKDSAIIQKTLGYIPGENAFFDDMKGMEFLKFMANLRGQKDLTRMNELIDFFELDPNGRIKKMSKGMKQKVGIVCAFMHNPSILILDEPSSGLDPLMQNKFIQLVIEEKNRGKTILLSSHSFEEVERTCDRVGIIRKGILVTEQTVDALKKSERKLYIVSFEDTMTANKFASQTSGVVSQHENQVTVSVSDDFTPFVHALGEQKIIGLTAVQQSLEEIFMGYYGGENNV